MPSRRRPCHARDRCGGRAAARRRSTRRSSGGPMTATAWNAMVVTIDGTTDRPDGSTFHITWSLDKSKGREARESNDVLKERGWTSFDRADPGHARAGALLMTSRSCSSTAMACSPISMRARPTLLGMSPRAFEERHGKREFWRRIASAPRFLRAAAADGRCAPAVRCGGASRPDHPDRPAARQLGRAAKGRAGPRSISPARRSSPAWRATSIAT